MFMICKVHHKAQLSGHGWALRSLEWRHRGMAAEVCCLHREQHEETAGQRWCRKGESGKQDCYFLIL